VTILRHKFAGFTHTLFLKTLPEKATQEISRQFTISSNKPQKIIFTTSFLVLTKWSLLVSFIQEF